MSPNDYRQPSKVHAARTVRLLRKISIARANWQIVSIRCAGVWMRELPVEMDNRKAISRGSSKVINRDSSKGSNRDSRGKRDSKEKRVNRDKVNKDSRDSRARRVVSSRDNKLVDHKAGAARRVEEIVAASIARE